MREELKTSETSLSASKLTAGEGKMASQDHAPSIPAVTSGQPATPRSEIGEVPQ